MPMGQVPTEPGSTMALLSKSIITGNGNAVQCIHIDISQDLLPY